MNLGIKGQSGTGEIEPSSACYTAFDGERRRRAVPARGGGRAGRSDGGGSEQGPGREERRKVEGGWMICSCRLAQRAGGSGGKARVDETRCEMMHLEGF